MYPLLSAVVIVVVVALVAGYVLAIIWRLWHMHQLRARVKGHLILTFDDGPGPRMTSQIRDLLHREGVRATFFVTGFRVDRHPDVVKQTIRDGHELASHSQLHLNAWRSPLLSIADTRKGLLSVRAIWPEARFFRPPFGKATLWTHLVCLFTGFQVVYWTVDCKDAEKHTIRNVEEMTQELSAKGGGIVLMHDLDMDPQAFPEREEQVLRLCEALIRSARSQGMKIIPLGHLFPSSQSTR